jgi:hypothetical protein
MKLTHLLIACAALSAGCSSPNRGAGDPAVDPNAPDEAGVSDPGGDEAGQDAAPSADYPPPPYGFNIGDTFPPLEFQGYKQAVGDWTPIAMRDYYDPDGSRGNYGIYFVIGAQWCIYCKEEADLLSRIYPTQYQGHGGVVLTAIIQDGGGKPATQRTVDQWIAAHHIDFDIVGDGTYSSLPQADSIGLPYGYVINPRDMKIFQIAKGVKEGQTTIIPLNVLMKKNGGSPGT